MKAHVLEVKFNYGGKDDTLYPVILTNSRECILVDCGYTGFLPLIENAAQQKGLSLENLTGILITHHDIDHIGGLYEIKEAYPSVKIYSNDIEEKYISGKTKSLRLQQAENIFAKLPEDQKQQALNFQEFLKTIKPVNVDVIVSEKNNFSEGVEIINTPGHMPGHISIYLKENKTLIAADALVIEDGTFEIANPEFTLDLEKAVESVKKLSGYEIDEIVCYHGGSMKNDIQQKMDKLIKKYSGSK